MSVRITRRGLLVGTAVAGLGGIGLGSLPGPLPAWAQDSAEAARTNHALLVAVTAYPNLPPNATLAGPNNDASLVREFLTTSSPVRFAPENVRVLADGLADASSPTRNSIRSALDELTAKVKRDDFVYLHFSGHGTQQPSIMPEVEPDGMDEVFLPSDTGMWKNREEGIPNALIDKEMRDHLQAIRDKGAFIWAVFDCCHSGTMTRDVSMMDQDITDRKIDFTTLGISQEEMDAARAGSESASRGMGGADEPRKNALGLDFTETGAQAIAPAGMVAFFAAQTVETTPEMPLPKGAPDATKLGLFTYTLFAKIAENANVTYRQLGQAILQDYSAQNRTRPTPLFEGDLDKPVFGMKDGDRIAQWAIKAEGSNLEIPAGQLHRLAPGSKLAIVPAPNSTIDDALGYVEVVSAQNLTSRLLPIEYEGKPALPVAKIPAGAYARLAELAVGFELVVSRPGGTDEFSAETERLNQMLDQIVEDKMTPVKLRLVGATDAADLKLAVMSEMDVATMIAEQEGEDKIASSRASLSTEPRIWFLPPTVELSLEEGKRPPSIALSGESEDTIMGKLANNLVVIFRATSLAGLSAASDYAPEEVSVGFKILRTESPQTEPLQPGTVPLVHPEDQVHIEATNDSSKPVDINVLYIGSDYSISHMYAERLHGGAKIDVPLLAFTDTSYGVERMIVVLSEARPQTAVEDLSFLEQIGVRSAGTKEVVTEPSFGDLLRQVAAAPETRGAAKLGGTSQAAKGAVMIFPLETVPRA